MAEHPVVHIEFSSHDLHKMTKFYSDVFGWKVEQMPEMNYATFDPGEGPGGGFNPVNEGNPQGSVIVYIGTADIPGDLAKIEKLGGKVIVPKTEIPQMGWFAIFEDLTGNRVGLYTAMMA